MLDQQSPQMYRPCFGFSLALIASIGSLFPRPTLHVSVFRCASAQWFSLIMDHNQEGKKRNLDYGSLFWSSKLTFFAGNRQK